MNDDVVPCFTQLCCYLSDDDTDADTNVHKIHRPLRLKRVCSLRC